MTGKVVSICALLLVITFVAYLSICLRQFSYLKPANYRLVILSVRCAALLPLCAFFIMISLLAPSSFVIMMLVITVVEGYCLYCFLALIVENFGGPFAIVDYLHKARKELAICGCIFPKEPLRFYQITTLAVFNIFVVRSALSLLAAICFYANTNAGRAFYVLFNATSACILLYGMVCTINLYYGVYEHSVNLFGVLKLALLKLTVGVIVVQGLIENILYSSGTFAFSDDDAFSGEQKALRAYCALVLIELALLAVLYYYAFGDHEITPSSAPAAVRAFLSLSEGRSPSLRATTSGVRAVETLVYSFSSYMRDVFSVQDVLVPGYFSAGIGGTAGEGEGEYGLLSEPLNSFCIGSGSGDADEDTGGGGGAVPGNGGRAGTGARAGAGAGGVTNALHSGAAKHAGFLEVITSPVRNNAGFWSPDRSSNNRNNKNGPAGTSQQKQQYSPVPATSTAAAGQEEQGGSLSPFVNMSDIYGQQEQGDRSLSFRSPSSSAAAVGKGPADTNAKTGTSTGAGPNSPYVDFTAVYGDPSDQNGTFSV